MADEPASFEAKIAEMRSSLQQAMTVRAELAQAQSALVRLREGMAAIHASHQAFLQSERDDRIIALLEGIDRRLADMGKRA